jgi:hypothetical protein
MTSVDRPRVVVLGGGFGDYRRRALAQVTLDVTLIDQRIFRSSRGASSRTIVMVV